MRKVRRILLIFAFTLFAITAFSKVQAASAKITANKNTANVGETVEVTVSINAAAWNLKVSGNASDTIVGYDDNGNNVSTTKKYSVNLSKAGTYTVNLTGDITDTTEQSSNINTSVSITATQNQTQPQQPAATAGGKLSSITVNGKTYKDPKQDITVTVGNEVESTTVSAVSADGSAVSGTGKTTLKVGSNTVNLKVGGTNYVVRINRLAKVEEETPPNLIDETQTNSDKNEDALALNSIEIKGFTFTPEFSKDVFSYTLDIDMEKNDVSELEINVVPNKQNAKVAITGNKLLQEGENIINITVTSEDGKETVTYQLKVNKIVYSTEVVGQNHDEINDLNEELEDTTKTSKTVQIIIVAIAIIGLVCGIIFAIIEYIYTNKKENDNEENEYNEPFYIKENEEGRIEVVDENNDLYDDEENEKIDEEDIDNKKLDDETENMGYIEELYKYNFPDEDIEEEIEKPKRKKSKGKHF